MEIVTGIAIVTCWIVAFWVANRLCMWAFLFGTWHFYKLSDKYPEIFEEQKDDV